MRTCSITGFRLPSALLMPLTVRKHPETGVPWQIPASFVPADLEAAEAGEHLVEGDSIDGAAHSSKHIEELEELSFQKSSARSRRPRGEMWSYMACTHQAFHYRTSARRKSPRLSLYLNTNLSESLRKKMHWRGDMPTLVLNLIQGRVLRLLEFLATRDANAITPWDGPMASDSSASLNPSPEANAFPGKKPTKPYIIWLDSPADATVSDPTFSITGPDEAAPDRGLLISTKHEVYHFRVTQCPDSIRLAAFDLNDLLNNSQIRWLRKQCPIYQHKVIAIKSGAASVEMLSWLWRLTLYIGDRQVERGKEASSK